ncbi:hypothetical protein QNH47_06240 [Virgibacillus halodenitrificans]|uniref:hypothetical protein n=1 Tax=Virgibacillus halodenitrificans TaxID=1482 RepID=UPI0024BF24BA|nr:hypothetical protein [Virgibacillus halodenitrificans]WHX27452.1 hypothetical protein QNH47_06240 [Virgibacillus halodenitrificans]
MRKNVKLDELLLNRNIYTNIIGYNPHESDHGKMQNMDLKEFAKLHGYRFRKRKFKKILREIEIDGKRVFTFSDNGKTIVLVNPYLFKPAGEGSNDTLKVVFN